MRIIIFTILVIFFCSCAARKVSIVKEKTKTKIDSVAITKTDSSSIINKNVYFNENTSELEIKPLIDSLPIVIDGKSYFNAILKYKKQNKVLVTTFNKKVSKNVLKEVSKHKQETKNVKEKTVDKKANYFVYLLILLIPLAMYIWTKFKQTLFL